MVCFLASAVQLLPKVHTPPATAIQALPEPSLQLLSLLSKPIVSSQHHLSPPPWDVLKKEVPTLSYHSADIESASSQYSCCPTLTVNSFLHDPTVQALLASKGLAQMDSEFLAEFEAKQDAYSLQPGKYGVSLPAIHTSARN